MNAVEKLTDIVVSAAFGAEPAMLSSSAVAVRCVSLSVSDGAVPVVPISGPWTVIVTTCGVPPIVVTVKVRSAYRLHGALNRAVGVVESESPHTGRRHRESAVAAGAFRRRTDRRKGVGRIVDSVSVSVPVAISRPGEALATPTAPTTEPVVVPEMTAASSVPMIVMLKV